MISKHLLISIFLVTSLFAGSKTKRNKGKGNSTPSKPDPARPSDPEKPLEKPGEDLSSEEEPAKEGDLSNKEEPAEEDDARSTPNPDTPKPPTPKQPVGRDEEADEEKASSVTVSFVF